MDAHSDNPRQQKEKLHVKTLLLSLLSSIFVCFSSIFQRTKSRCTNFSVEDFLNFPNQNRYLDPITDVRGNYFFPLYDFVALVRVWRGIDDELQDLVARPGSDSLPDEAAPGPALALLSVIRRKGIEVLM